MQVVCVIHVQMCMCAIHVCNVYVDVHSECPIGACVCVDLCVPSGGRGGMCVQPVFICVCGPCAPPCMYNVCLSGPGQRGCAHAGEVSTAPC